ncbi:hypothetical protein C2E19_14305 [Pseudomonas sp. DTU12.3]|nr:hypothetical protein C2E19_14305 [Pseudomonas sp. DTU12.3]
MNAPVGASLLAKAVRQSPQVLNVQTLSRAGSLPQGLLCRCNQCFSSRTLFSSAPSILNVAVLSMPSR